jgi:hypothetical protein
MPLHGDASSTVKFTVDEAVLLCTGWVDRVATTHHIRALAIKGHVLDTQGLRDPSNPIDVDILVDPSGYEAMLAALAAFGWRTESSTVAVRKVSSSDKHSATLFHEEWPISLDVHRYFPGFLGNPQDVFEALWERRVTARVATVDVRAIDPVGHAALQALHLGRTPREAATHAAMTDLVNRTRRVLGDAGLNELSVLATAVGADESLAAFLTRVGAPEPTSSNVPARAHRQWQLRTEAPPQIRWLNHIGQLRVREWPLGLWHALMLTNDEIDAYHREAGQSRASARWQRIRRAAVGIPAALALLRQRQRGSSPR